MTLPGQLAPPVPARVPSIQVVTDERVIAPAGADKKGDSPPRSAPRTGKPGTRVGWPAAVVVVLGAIGGLVLRLWIVTHFPSTADEDMIAMIAQFGLHGHFQALIGGQYYGGTAEPYLIAPFLAVFGDTAVVARLVEAGLGAGSALLVWRIMLRLLDNRSLAALAGVLAWCASAAAVRVSASGCRRG